MKIETVKMDQLVSPDYNPRYISDEDMQKLENSLKEFGYVDPLIVNRVNNHIVGGNQRYAALKRLGYTTVDVIFIEEPNMSREKALNVALNKIAGDFDIPKLESLFDDLKLDDFDLTLTGFDEIELQEFNFNDDDTDVYEPTDIVEDDFSIDDNEDVEVNVKYGDLFQLGNHYLLCGDATLPSDVKKLVTVNNSEREREQMIRILFTSPPYSDMRDYHTTDENLDLSNIIKFIETFKPYTNYQVINLGLQYKDKEVYCYWDKYIEFAKKTGYKFLSWNIWNRKYAGSIGAQMRMFPLCHEWIFIFGTEPYEINKTIPKKEENININSLRGHRTKEGNIKYHNPGDTSNPYKKMGTVIDQLYFTGHTDHPAVFPVELPSAYIEAMTNEGDNVVDCFGGSGTTLIACEQLNRNCYMMEIDPYYCQLIINRFEDFTGKKAMKIN